MPKFSQCIERKGKKGLIRKHKYVTVAGLDTHYKCELCGYLRALNPKKRAKLRKKRGRGGEGGNGGVGSGDSPDGFRLFTWGGKLRRAPLNYMPRWRANFRIACGLWFQGVKSLGVRPLCDVPACDLGGGLDIAARRTATKPYSDWK